MGATPAPADQLATQQNMIIGGTSGTLDVASLKLAGTPVYRFTADFSMVFNGGFVNFRQNLDYPLDAALLVALLANSAPMTEL